MFSLVARRSRCLSVSSVVQRAAAARWGSTLVVSEPLLETAVASPGTQATVTAAQKLNDNSIDLLVVGDRECENNEVAVRTRSGQDLGSMPIETLAAGLGTEVASRGRTILED